MPFFLLSRKGPPAGYAGSDASGDTSSAVRRSAQEPNEETSQNRRGSVGVLSLQGPSGRGGCQSTLGSVSLPTAPRRSAACREPFESRKNDRRPVRPYSSGVAASSYFAGAPSVLAPRIT